MYTSESLLPISALQHFLFCPRQCALIHVERLWAENAFTAKGNSLHERAHGGISESRAVKRVESALPLVSDSLGLIGESDVVEFYKDGRIVPIEYKKGKPKVNFSDTVQLCAQALCLEEMLGRDIPEGFLFYYGTMHREKVVFDKEIRDITLKAIDGLREMINKRKTPPPEYGKKCSACSFSEICLPKTLSSAKKVKNYWEKMVNSPLGGEDETFS